MALQGISSCTLCTTHLLILKLCLYKVKSLVFNKFKKVMFIYFSHVIGVGKYFFVYGN